MLNSTSPDPQQKKDPLGSFFYPCSFTIYPSPTSPFIQAGNSIQEDLVFHPISSSEIVTSHLVDLLKNAQEAPRELLDSNCSLKWDDLEEQHYKQWAEARENHRQRTRKFADYREESLTTSHRARIAMLNEQLQQNENENIQKMHLSQIASAEEDYARHKQELNIAAERSDITAEAVAYGVLIIDGAM